jgi:hypothetical protein
MIHPPHLTLYAIVAAATCGASLVFLVFVSLYSSARVLVHLMHWARELGEGRRDLQLRRQPADRFPGALRRRLRGVLTGRLLWRVSGRPRGSPATGSSRPRQDHLHRRLRQPERQAGLALCRGQGRAANDRAKHGAGVGIDGDRQRNRAPTLIKERGEDGLLGIDEFAETYWHIHRQQHSAWTQELDLRPFKETF